MDPVFVAKKSFQVVGMEMHSSEGYEYGSLWERFVPRMEEIEKKANPDPIFYGVIEPTGVKREFTYMACVDVSEKGNIPKGMVHKVIPSSSYAVFTHKGSLNNLTDTFQYIYGTWYPKSGKKRTDGPEFELYGEKFLGPMNEDSEFEIYIPILP
ncbi:GyrI-like domain-containing protein [Paenibacillus apiarius]|uniref:GyrI-like domain-containing protein n=1 Tax=Paenibacillus apiarius TaxID=46240 RepID=A0ABT4DVG3_9BACL|nr:GyrI-like domain-containing protein [Paenibacillus apiarius]MCY9514786.1 GyrI-like domain-containing protein [Paenibacillus apiarius]MCY9521334.1 GyrI-like domain-containing protein [Paenibacillus apiarius]MCY9554050.1 GyrI-like domain-containing protein [Paenibacillus apiarius]MCY9560424.1 GyrI-like domain-containing protein [Paenibacillus apiarius]MCY9682239.1 GyrI-like domain-containing protein [Paenibacillus apiarius]